MSSRAYQNHIKYYTSPLLWPTVVLCIFLVQVNSSNGQSDQTLAAEPTYEELLTGEAFIYAMEPDERGGKAYKLLYLVDVPIDVLWRFKTDFDANFLLTHEFIKKHRLVSKKRNIAITETEYSNNPNALFRWRTILSPSTYRMDFILENPDDCGQDFHYGHIQLSALRQHTKVTQVAYFDFLGVTLWELNPWTGGMSEFLEYTARWEQETALRLKERYASPGNSQIGVAKP